MLLASIAIGVVIVALLWDLLLPPVREAVQRQRARRAIVPSTPYDPGRERRAEQRARELLRSCVNDEEWSMYRDLGFIRVWGTGGVRWPAPSVSSAWGARWRRRRSGRARRRTTRAPARRTPT